MAVDWPSVYLYLSPAPPRPLFVCRSVVLSVCPIVPAQHRRNRSAIFSLYIPNLVRWCIIMRRCIMQKEGKKVHYLRCQGHSEGVWMNGNLWCAKNFHTKIKIWLFLRYSHKTSGPFANTLDLIVQHHKPVFCLKIRVLRSRLRSQRRFRMSVNVCLNDVFWTTECFVTTLGMLVQHNEPECHAEKIVHCLQCQGYSEGLYNQNMTLSTISSIVLNCWSVYNQTWFDSKAS